MRIRPVNELKRATLRTQNEFLEMIQKFEKRSKFITIRRKSNFWGLLGMQIDIEKENKVTEEMRKYIKSFCDYVEEEKSGTVWYYNYDSYALPTEEEDEWTLQFEICIHFER